ncbi:MAG: HD domain-containing protein [Desulfobacterales bacterium]|jgi:putative nucleotidyltransferase with HDIG domain|nr:HD domain-containing protein [Desulfobacterales bacterium]
MRQLKTQNLLIQPVPLASLQDAFPAPAETPLGTAALTFAIGCQDLYTRGHGFRVAAYAERIARRLGLSTQETDTVRIGGLLHDIGKLALSPRLMTNTRAELSAAMRAEIHRHPEIGRAFLEALNVAPPILDCVHYHHERLDGSGYPVGLDAARIPVGAQIISVADCFDALTTDRPYQRGKHPSQALAILETLAGSALSADLVRTLCREVRENGVAAAAMPLHPGRFGVN